MRGFPFLFFCFLFFFSLYLDCEIQQAHQFMIIIELQVSQSRRSPFIHKDKILMKLTCFPCEISTSLFNKIQFSLLMRIFRSVYLSLGSYLELKSHQISLSLTSFNSLLVQQLFLYLKAFEILSQSTFSYVILFAFGSLTQNCLPLLFFHPFKVIIC